MIVEKGGFYQDAKGEKRGPVLRHESNPLLWHYLGSLGFFRSDGTSLCGYDPDLIRKWVEPDTPPIFEDMSDAEQGALLLAKHRGKPTQVWDEDAWIKSGPRARPNDHLAYRIAPTRIHGSVETDADGSPDFSTWEADQ